MLRGIRIAVSAQRKVFLLATAAVFVADIAVPPLLLSLVRKPVDFFTFNPWLASLPEYFRSGAGSLDERLAKVWGLALFWFSSDNPYGIEWGFAVTLADLSRVVLMALLVGSYFALWVYRRQRMGDQGWSVRTSGQGGALGAASSVLGVATGSCTVMGCGAPVIPVVGLVFTGLSSGALTWMSRLSTTGTAVVFAAMAIGVLYQAWWIGSARPRVLLPTTVP